MGKALVVAWREFRHTAMTKAFMFGAVLMPVLMMGIFIVVIPLMVESNQTPLTGTVAVIASADVIGELEDAFADEADEPPTDAPPLALADPMAQSMAMIATVETDITIMAAHTADLADLKEQVRRGDLTALMIIDEAVITDLEGSVEVLVPGYLSPNHTDTLQSAARSAVVDTRLRRLGHEPADLHRLLKRPRTLALRLTEDGGESAENEAARRLIPMAFMMLLWVAAFTSGNYLLTTTIEEKGNKVMEVLLSAVSPMQLMGGKILGQAGVSLVMLVMYGGAGMAALFAFAMLDLVPMMHLLYLALYFIMAYFMIATIMTAIGSAVTELRDAQSLMGPAMLLLIIPLALWPIVGEHPNGTLATVTGFIPPLTPFIMIQRVTAATEPVAAWQIIASLVIGFAAVAVMLWMCARIFRIGVLAQGKPPGFMQLLRWVRMG